MKLRSQSVRAALLLGSMLAGPCAAIAQDTPARAPEAELAGQPDSSDIIVTARRTSERLQEVPVAMTAISSEAIQTQNLSDSRDLVKIAPNLGFTGGATTKLVNFTVRGVGTYVNSDGFDQSVGVAFDGVSLARPGGSVADLVDIERVEVLEGPQGMLFGRNASAGLINIISRRPELNERSASGRVSFGSYNEIKAEAAVNLPLGDTLALRLAGWRFRHDGYVNAPRLGRDIGVKSTDGQRARLRWQPDDAFDAVLTFERTGADQDPAVTTIRRFASNGLGVRDWEIGQGIVAGPTNETTSSATPITSRSNSEAYTVDLQYDVGGPTVALLASQRHIRVYDRFDGTATSSPVLVTGQDDNIRYRQRSIELRLNSPSGDRLQYVFGGIYYDMRLTDVFRPDIAGSVPTPVAITTTTDQKSTHYGAFGEITYSVTPAWKLIAGGRISTDRVSGGINRVYRATPAVIIPPFNGPGATFGPYAVRAETSNTEPSFRVGTQLELAPDIMVYGTVSRGYKAAGLDLAATVSSAVYAVNQLEVRPEIAMNYEAGLRTQFFDRRLTLNVTAWHEVFTDFQTAVRLPEAATPLFSMENAGELQSTGVTVKFDARATDEFTLSGSGSYIDARYTDFKNAACYPGQPAAAAGAPLVRGVCVGGVQSLDGYALINSPKWRGEMTARYERGGIGGLRVFAQGAVRYQSREEFSTVADPVEFQNGFATVNLSAGVGSDDGTWKLSVYGSNVFDQKFVSRTISQVSGTYYVNIVPYDARARWGVALDFAF